MVSPETLENYSFFNFLTHEQLKEVAIITTEIKVEKGEIIFRTGELGEYLYILTEGSVELIYIAKDDRDPEIEKEILVGEIRPGEPFGISSFIEPHILTATAKVTCAGKAIKITAEKLHALCENDPQMAY